MEKDQSLSQKMLKGLRLDTEEEVKIFFYSFAILHIFLTLLTFISWDNEASWIIYLVSLSLRVSFWIIIGLIFLRKDKILLLLLIAVFFNIPAGISDIMFKDKYDDVFIFIRLPFLFMAFFLINKFLFKQRFK